MVLPLNGSEVELVPDNVVIAGQAVPQGMMTTPFDALFVGIPVYVLIECFCLLVLFAAIGWWLVRLRAMSDVSGFKDLGSSIKTGDPILVWRLDNNLRLAISCLSYSAGCISFQDIDPRNRSIWVHSGKGSSVTVGGRPGVIVSETYAYTRDLAAESALMASIARYNESVADPKAKIHLFTDWQMFGRKVLQSMYPDGLPVPAYRQLDPKQIDTFMPKNNTPKFFGSMVWQDAAELVDTGDAPEGFFSKYAPLMLLSAFAMIAIVGAWLFPLGG